MLYQLLLLVAQGGSQRLVCDQEPELPVFAADHGNVLTHYRSKVSLEVVFEQGIFLHPCHEVFR